MHGIYRVTRNAITYNHQVGTMHFLKKDVVSSFIQVSIHTKRQIVLLYLLIYCTARWCDLDQKFLSDGMALTTDMLVDQHILFYRILR